MRTIGTFDENIYPVYYEDQDYEWRLELAGNPWPCAVLDIVATRGASSLQSRRDLAGLTSVHVRDVLVVHGSEDAEG